MKVEKKAGEGCIVELRVQADASEIAQEYAKTEKVFFREAQVPGFRKGKVPQSVVRQKFADGIKQEATQACFRALYPEALKKAGLEPVALSNVKDLILDPETGFSFTAEVEVDPEFKLPKYKKLAIKTGDTEVKEEAVDRQLAAMRTSFATYADAAGDDAIGEGDFVNFDYKGTLDGKDLAEVAPGQKIVSGVEGYWTQVSANAGGFYPEIVDALKGMKAGESKDGVKVAFPETFNVDAVKGKTAEYSIAVKSFRRRILPSDAELAEKSGSESFEALRKSIRERLEKQAIEADVADRRNQAAELLLSKADFAVPESLVRGQARHYLEDLSARAQYAGISGETIAQNSEKILKDAQEFGQKTVRLDYVLKAIAKEEKLEVRPEDLDKALAEIAESQGGGRTADDIRKTLESNGGIDNLKANILKEKTIDFILSEAK